MLKPAKIDNYLLKLRPVLAKSFKKALGVTAVILVNLVIVVGVLELGLRLFKDQVPTRYETLLPRDVALLQQSSKSSELPASYIGIFGDSYAAGAGDWYVDALEREPFGHPSFHSAHMINTILGEDVLSFGRPGAGSFDGIIYYPIKYYELIRERGINLPPPETIVVYFYEGNDLNNNLNFLQRYFGEDRSDFSVAELKQQFSELLAGDAHPRNRFEKWQSKLPILRHSFSYNILRTTFLTTKQFIAGEEEQPASLVQGCNSVKVQGNVLQIREPVQSPALELEDQEIGNAILVFRASIEYLMEYFSSSRIVAVYIPSPASIYEMANDQVCIQTYHDRNSSYSKETVQARNQLISSSIAEVTAGLGIEFVDASAALKVAAKNETLHGPRDWKHFNKRGYTILGQEVSAGLRAQMD